MKLSITLLFVLLCSCKIALGQKYYPPITYDPSAVGFPKGVVGTLYNSFPYQIKGASSYYNGPVDLYGMVYLPFIKEEYDGQATPLPFSPAYTTGIALCAEKAPALGLYAPSEVVALDMVPGDFFYKILPFANIIPQGSNMLDYKGPFDYLTHLNERPSGDFFMFPSQVGISVLEGTQKFCAFTHDFFNWNGIDRNGDTCISSMVSYDSPSGFSYLLKIAMYNLSEDGYPQTSRDIIGHEIAHGILAENLGLPPSGDENPDDSTHTNPELQPEMDAMDEAFCDIMGLSFDNWYSPGKFDNPNWLIGHYQLNSADRTGKRSFDKPKSKRCPTTYKGQYYGRPGDRVYDPHINASVMSFWFYLLNSETLKGKIDDNPAKPYVVHRLIPENLEATWKLALNVVFKTFTEKLTYQSTFADAREATLQALQELGHPVGSHAYIQMCNAWYAVGVGKPWDPSGFNKTCSPNISGETWYSGTVSFNTLKTTLKADLTSDPIYQLKDCTEPPGIETYQFNAYTDSVELAMDGDHNGVFQSENNVDISKSSVGVHWATTLCNRWFKNQFQYSGPDGIAQLPIKNILGDPAHPNPEFDISAQTYFYPFAPEASNLDAVAQIYFQGVNHFIKSDQNQIQDYNHPEWEAIRNGLAQIFALNVKNNYRINLPQMLAPSWTLGEDIPGAPRLFNFSIPGNSVQPAVYEGKEWDTAYPARNASILDFWYYLLVHGTESPKGYTSERGKTYFIFPIPNSLALDLIWKAYKTVPLYSKFVDFRQASIDALLSMGYTNQSKEYIALYDAWAAILDQPDFASTLKYEPLEGEIIDPWPASLGVQVEYPELESKRIFEVSENRYFDESQENVYRFFNYVAPNFANGMVYGNVYLKPEKTYYVRSRLYESGGNFSANGNCDTTEDPVFCHSLEGKEKWTVPYSFKTGKKEVNNASPVQSSVAPAWETPFNWEATPGAQGYVLKITDDEAALPQQEFAIDELYDADVAKVYKNLALSKNHKYTYTLAPRAKLGSQQGVKVIIDPLSRQINYRSLSPEEKAAYPNTFGRTTTAISFKTDIPKVTLGLPANNTHVPMLGALTTSAIKNEPRASYYRWEFFYQDDFQEPKHAENHEQAEVTIGHIENLLHLEDQHVYGWTFTPWRKAEPPFIPVDEPGETAPPLHFIVDKQLIPAPVLLDFPCAHSGQDLIFKWTAIPGAKGYEYRIVDTKTHQTVRKDIVNQSETPAISGITVYPNAYQVFVKAGVKNALNQWIWGPEGSFTFQTRPPLPSGLEPNNISDVPLDQDHSVTLKWEASALNLPYRLKFSQLVNGVIQEKGKFDVDKNFFTLKNLEYDTHYYWTVTTNSGLSNCESAASGYFKTEPEPVKVIPELGINFILLDCNAYGVCWPDIRYTISVLDPGGRLVLNKMALLSNAAGNPVVYPYLNQPGTISGNLHTPKNGTYTITIRLTEIGKGAPSIATWVFDAKVMDIWRFIHNQGPPEELANITGGGQINVRLNTSITIKLKYDASSKTVIIQ